MKQRTIPVLCRMFKTAMLVLALFASSHARAAMLNVAEKTLWQQAFAALDEGNEAQARALAARGHDPQLAKAFAWQLHLETGDSAKWAEIAAFIEANPGWMGLLALRRQVERFMPNDRPDAAVAAWFSKYPALTPDGVYLHAKALSSLGKKQEMRKLVREFRLSRNMPAARQAEYAKRFSSVLRAEDDAALADALVWRGEYEAAKSMLPKLAAGQKALISARIALAGDKKDANAKLKKVPADLLDDPGLAYERLRWRRRAGMTQGAIDLLAGADMGGHAADFWKERHILAQDAIENGKWTQAAKILSHHGLKSGADWAQAEWMIGWVILRGLQKPQEALGHFEKLHAGVSTPQSLSRAAYWAGRAADAMKDSKRAGGWYLKAAAWSTTYYGQAAIARLGSSLEKQMAKDIAATPAEVAEFDARELVITARKLGEVGPPADPTPFLKKIAELSERPYEYDLAARLAHEAGKPGVAVQIARDSAAKSGVELVPQGYPRLAGAKAPASHFLSLVHGVIRQESGFDHTALSSAGARGMMQVMPSTAKHVARKLGVAVGNDAASNLRLGSTYLKTMMDDFAGSAVLALAAYNAGPSRAREWIRRFGDPRAKGVDVIDWIEKLPVSETRNYIQRVLENTQVYEILLNRKS